METEQVRSLITVLRKMDEFQRETDDAGGAEVAWYYYRDAIEDVIGLKRGELDTEESIPAAH